MSRYTICNTLFKVINWFSDSRHIKTISHINLHKIMQTTFNSKIHLCVIPTQYNALQLGSSVKVIQIFNTSPKSDMIFIMLII